MKETKKQNKKETKQWDIRSDMYNTKDEPRGQGLVLLCVKTQPLYTHNVSSTNDRRIHPLLLLGRATRRKQDKEFTLIQLVILPSLLYKKGIYS